jgi:hypothetical protein
LEPVVERSVRRLHSQVAVKNDKRLSQRLDDVVCIGMGFRLCTFQLPAFGDVSKDQHDTGHFPFVVGDRGGIVADRSLKAVFAMSRLWLARLTVRPSRKAWMVGISTG